MFKFIMPKFIFKVEKWKWNKEFRLYVSNTGKFMNEYKKPIPCVQKKEKAKQAPAKPGINREEI